MASSLQTNVLLYGFAKQHDAPSPSGFCQKVESFLRATSIPYELRSTMPSSGPKGKLPYITLGNVTVADSHFILRHLIDSGLSRNLDASLTRSQRADSRAWQTYFEELIYPLIVRERWCIDANYYVLVEELFGHVPWPIRPVLGWWLRRSIRNTLWMQGVGRHNDTEAQALLAKAVDDLDAKFENGRTYFHGGDQPSEIDIIIFAFLVNALACEVNPFFNRCVLAKPSLIAFTKHMTLKLFPEYHRILSKLDTPGGKPHQN